VWCGLARAADARLAHERVRLARARLAEREAAAAPAAQRERHEVGDRARVDVLVARVAAERGVEHELVAPDLPPT